MDYVRQAYGRTCGQACVAMVAGKTEQDIIDIIGHSRGTKTREILKALKALNIENSGKLIVIGSKTELPEVAIIKAIPKRRKHTSGGWHWLVKFGDKILDPYSTKGLKNMRFTSFITISQ